MHPQYLPLLDSILAWARANPEVQGIILIGSQARSEWAPDQWSDLDLMVLVTDQQRLMRDTAWFGRFGSVVSHFEEIVPLHFTSWNWCVRRVLFAGHRDIDFSILPYAMLDEVLAVNKGILSKGFRVLYDPCADLLDGKISAMLQAMEPARLPALSAEELNNVVSELLYHVIWALKKIKRRELWIATGCINVHMRGLLLRLIEMHNAATARRPDFLQYSGRFLEQRADPRILAMLKDCFTSYDEASATAALAHLYDITHALAGEICASVGYPFDSVQFAGIQAMFEEMKLQ